MTSQIVGRLPTTGRPGVLPYRLVVTTDGRPHVLERTLTALWTRVTPRPAEIAVVDDSGTVEYRRYLEALLPTLAIPWRLTWHPARLGFCAAVTDAWKLATGPGVPFVFWLEDDIEIVRGIDLGDLAHVLTKEPKIAQMGLMRQPVNEQEKKAGSLFALYRDRYDQRGVGTKAWLRSTTNFTTTSSLMRREFMVEQPWPGYDKDCEGRYSIDLLGKGYTFGVWGTGEAWVNHFGERSGTGY